MQISEMTVKLKNKVFVGPVNIFRKFSQCMYIGIIGQQLFALSYRYTGGWNQRCEAHCTYHFGYGYLKTSVGYIDTNLMLSGCFASGNNSRRSVIIVFAQIKWYHDYI